jgi:uncharacterized protein YkwD
MVLRRSALLLCTLALTALLTAAPTLASGTNQAEALASSVLHDVKAVRVAHGLVALKPSPQLDDAAAAHTEEMVADGYFGHSSSDGLSFAARIAQYYRSASYAFWSVGENLLWSSGSIDSSAAVAAWMASGGHRAIILFPGWRQIGVAAVSSADAPGTYGGRPVTVITTDFGVRR